MSNDIGRAFDLQRSNPFELRNVHIMHSLEELDELGNDPKVPYSAVYFAICKLGGSRSFTATPFRSPFLSSWPLPVAVAISSVP